MAMWHFYSCFTINLVIEMTDFLLSTHMRMFTWYVLWRYASHAPNSPFFFHPSQSRLFFILLFSFQLIKFGFEISTPFKFNHTLNYWHILLLLEVKHLYAIHIFSGYYFAHRPTILLKWNHLYFCGGSILIREVHWRFFLNEKCSKGIKEPHSNLWIFFWKVFQEN